MGRVIARSVLSAGVEDPKAIGFRRISVGDLDWRPSPLRNADAWRPGELDQPVGSFDCNERPGFGSSRPVRTVGTKHIGEDGDRVGYLACRASVDPRLVAELSARRMIEASSGWTKAARTEAAENETWARPVRRPGRPALGGCRACSTPS